MSEGKKIVALGFSAEDGMTGAVVAYHVVEYIGADYRNGFITATLNGYVSENAFKSGKQYLLTRTLDFSETDVTAPDPDWVYRKALEGASGIPKDAQPVYAE
ncbi:TPA: hypothetical protein ACLAO4_000152 [Neisseria meningitidis]|uniref:hypothetical protein n=1 Tax=Neisseria meningitidis TaxID=487 RepID=UPI000E4A527B|nr:hypothetical protein [Neisseria meningitidis]